ncbi:MAG: hypothetical protein M3Y32_09760 [Pseudomonadota bacterium]|nr:hypothetical protein [Pseudomonadota bacterium]
MRSLSPFLVLLALCAWLPPALAKAYLPSSDDTVLATVPARATDPGARELLALRDAWRRDPNNLALAVRLSHRYFDEVAAEGDPRYVGYAQSALGPWFDQLDPPAPVRVLRAMILQFDHRFPPALADLDAALKADPGNGQAMSWRTAILMVTADYDAARRSCEQMAPLTTDLIAAACRAQVDSVTGHAERAATELRKALISYPEAAPAEKLWSLTRLAENQERRGQFAAAEAAFREALALGVPDVYLDAAYADFLLDRGRPAEVLKLLQGKERADVLLLRLALAAKATGDAKAALYTDEMAARFDAARLRGNTTHRKEESRFVLALQSDVPRALTLAQSNFAIQKEPADARILLEAAVAAKDPAAAAPVLDWMARWHVESVALQSLVDRLKALK